MTVRKAAVIGAGLMGSGIAAQIANAGIPVVLLDIVPKGATNRNAIADAKLGGLAINDANFRVVDNVRRAVGHQEICLRARQRQAVVRGRQVLQLVECN